MVELSDTDRQRMDALSAELPTKSAKIRLLAAEGYARGDIARYLGIRYQFVYNVLSAPQAGNDPKAPAPAAERVRGFSCGPEVYFEGRSSELAEPTPKWIWTTVRKDGNITFPPAFLEALGAAEGDQVQLALEGDVIRILGRATALRELQEQVRRYVPEGVSLVDELIAERRTEAARENGA